jgi:hypothetical protein
MGDDPMALLGLEGALKHYYYYKWMSAGLLAKVASLASQMEWSGNHKQLRVLGIAAMLPSKTCLVFC